MVHQCFISFLVLWDQSFQLFFSPFLLNQLAENPLDVANEMRLPPFIHFLQWEHCRQRGAGNNSKGISELWSRGGGQLLCGNQSLLTSTVFFLFVFSLSTKDKNHVSFYSLLYCTLLRRIHYFTGPMNTPTGLVITT